MGERTRAAGGNLASFQLPGSGVCAARPPAQRSDPRGRAPRLGQQRRVQSASRQGHRGRVRGGGALCGGAAERRAPPRWRGRLRAGDRVTGGGRALRDRRDAPIHSMARLVHRSLPHHRARCRQPAPVRTLPPSCLACPGAAMHGASPVPRCLVFRRRLMRHADTLGPASFSSATSSVGRRQVRVAARPVQVG